MGRFRKEAGGEQGGGNPYMDKSGMEVPVAQLVADLTGYLQDPDLVLRKRRRILTLRKRRQRILVPGDRVKEPVEVFGDPGILQGNRGLHSGELVQRSPDILVPSLLQEERFSVADQEKVHPVVHRLFFRNFHR
jgi:hypothetical protein